MYKHFIVFSEHIPHHLPPNVKVLNWIPQNDLLAHNSTKVFISHTGHNSLYESAFYGVPLVCIPLFADQFSNCVQAESVGLAVRIDIKSMSEEEIYQKIQLVLNTPRYFSPNIIFLVIDCYLCCKCPDKETIPYRRPV